MKKFFLCFAAIILLLSGLGGMQTQAATKKFSDVPVNHWAAEAISSLVNQGIINGYSNGKFGVNDKITKTQAAVMLSRALNLNTKSVANPGFKDIKSTYWAYGSIAATTNLGMFNRGGNFYPNNILTRAQMAQALVKGYNLSNKYNYSFRDVGKSYWAYNYISTIASNGITTGIGDGTFQPEGGVTRGQFAKFLYNTIKLDSVNPAPAPTPTKTPVIGNIALGMTKQEVKNTTGGYLAKEDATRLLYSGANVLGLTADIIYEFSDNSLTSINIYHDVVNNAADLELLEEYFYLMYDNISSVYGEAAYIDADWGDDIDSYSWAASWPRQGFGTYLIVNVALDYSTWGGLRITIE
ncbi:S-layer homology domain-containing protein [Bacillus sp. MMSF_3328]|uniref:S-layer homology domain-containing protein n=1 Tax=Bacillus sp. MMSF_3328 TaxID=3047080 RepID=UPI00273F1E23|nr:S-layer homology domain-containing protein [Bacillus sp. MMSF_3328]